MISLRIQLTIVTAVIVFGGCTQRRDETAKRVLANIYVGLRNYEAQFNCFPPQNGSRWRWSETTRFKTVTWRGLLLDQVATVGSPDPITTTELETHIDEAARANFTFDNCLVHSNFNNLQGTRLGDLPDHTILALTVVGSPGLDWTYEESINLPDILARHSEVALSKPCYLLFANGRIGEVTAPSQIINQLSHPRESAIYTDKEVVLNKIILLTDALRIPSKRIATETDSVETKK